MQYSDLAMDLSNGVVAGIRALKSSTVYTRRIVVQVSEFGMGVKECGSCSRRDGKGEWKKKWGVGGGGC